METEDFVIPDTDSKMAVHEPKEEECVPEKMSSTEHVTTAKSESNEEVSLDLPDLRPGVNSSSTNQNIDLNEINGDGEKPTEKAIAVPVRRSRKRMKFTGAEGTREIGKVYIIDSIPRKWDGKRFRTMCFVPNCKRHASGSSCRCIRHGGGIRCEVKGCSKSALRCTGRCATHGGGLRCTEPNCKSVAVGKTKKCVRHGGGRRCVVEGCSKAARGVKGKCKAHGGGRRCMEPNCPRSAEGSTSYCIAHGGGKRCEVADCTRGAQSGTDRCIAHGGGRRCEEPNCTKATQGPTRRCLSHGGGRRCKFTNCHAYARSADFCRNHGGGRLCKETSCSELALEKVDYCQTHLEESKIRLQKAGMRILPVFRNGGSMLQEHTNSIEDDMETVPEDPVPQQGNDVTQQQKLAHPVESVVVVNTTDVNL